MSWRQSVVVIALVAVAAGGSSDHSARGSGASVSGFHVPHGRVVAGRSRSGLLAVRDPVVRRETKALYACRSGRARPVRLVECSVGCFLSDADAKGCLAAYGWNHGDKY